MNSFLDQAGLEYFWAKIVAKIEGASVTLPKNLVKYSAVQSISATEILNATTLGGYSASYFAKASDVSDLSGSVSEQAQLLATLGPKVTALGTTVDSYETRVGNIESNNELQDTTIAQHSTAITQMAAKVNDHTLSIKTLGDTVGGYSNSISELSTSVNGINQNLQNKLDKSGGTMTGVIVANADSNPGVAQVRNVILSSADPTSSDGSDGDIWIKYEA